MTRGGRFSRLWLILSLAACVYLGARIGGDDKTLFIPGAMTDGHHQIEMACASCHTPFGGVAQASCLVCHEAELAEALDAHGNRKFLNPRNAVQLERLDVRRCIVCHTEHRPAITGEMGVTLPLDYCSVCHENVARVRPSHEGMSFVSCASAGCHNFHDNRALYEDFLLAHAREPSGDPPMPGADPHPATFPGRFPPRRTPIAVEPGDRRSLTAADADAPAASARGELVERWAGSAHARAGINCGDCHGAPWTDDPPEELCGTCHVEEPRGFRAGKHGMRLAAGFGPMTPALARLPMKSEASSFALGCGSCHDVHDVDLRPAAAAACLSCHADEHSESYPASPHGRSWESELAGLGTPGSGVSCASCHMPRLQEGDAILVQHNQNANLRPNEKMIREVCLTCHSLGLTIDALADPESIRRNFPGPPALHVESLEMARARRR